MSPPPFPPTERGGFVAKKEGKNKQGRNYAIFKMGITTQQRALGTVSSAAMQEEYSLHCNGPIQTNGQLVTGLSSGLFAESGFEPDEAYGNGQKH